MLILNKMRKICALLPVLGLAIACSSGHNEADENNAAGDITPAVDEKVTIYEEESMKIDGVEARRLIDEYLIIKDALVSGDAQAAAAAARQLSESMAKIDEHLAAEIQKEARVISEEENLAEQRELFESLSLKMYKFARIAEDGRTLYWQRCPMAMEGKGANWLSAEEDIRNPYYGKEMLECGKTIEEI